MNFSPNYSKYSAQLITTRNIYIMGRAQIMCPALCNNNTIFLSLVATNGELKLGTPGVNRSRLLDM